MRDDLEFAVVSGAVRDLELVVVSGAVRSAHDTRPAPFGTGAVSTALALQTLLCSMHRNGTGNAGYDFKRGNLRGVKLV